MQDMIDIISHMQYMIDITHARQHPSLSPPPLPPPFLGSPNLAASISMSDGYDNFGSLHDDRGGMYDEIREGEREREIMYLHCF